MTFRHDCKMKLNANLIFKITRTWIGLIFFWNWSKNIETKSRIGKSGDDVMSSIFRSISTQVLDYYIKALIWCPLYMPVPKSDYSSPNIQGSPLKKTNVTCIFFTIWIHLQRICWWKLPSVHFYLKLFNILRIQF